MMMSILEWLVIAALSFCIYIYFGYPLLIGIASSLFYRPIARRAVRPRVSLIIPVYNEETIIAEKIRNSLAVDYPEDLLEILVASDGSTDSTNAIVKSCRSARVRLLALPRQGKAHALNEAVRSAEGQILVFTDANSMLDRRSLLRIVENFGDPEVGGVCGNQKYRPQSGADATARGENLYWRFDKWLKSLESRTGSIFAADGSLYAIRNGLYVPMEDAAQADDIAISTRVVLQGFRLVYEPEAVTFEDSPAEGRAEFRRKIRVTNHSVRALLQLKRALWCSGFYSVELLSHKFFRHLVPFALVPLFAASVPLAASPGLYRALLLLQAIFYGLALTGFALKAARAGQWKLFSVPFFFCLANAAAFFGILNILRGERIRAWSPRGGAVTLAN